MELDLDLFGKLHAGINELNAHMREQSSLLQRLSDASRDAIIRGSGVCPNPTATFSFALDKSNVGQLGRIQQIRRIVVGAPLATATSPTATACIIMQAGSDPLTTSVDTGSVIDFKANPTFPLVGFYSVGQALIHNNEDLWVVITGAVANQQFVANAQIEDYPDGGYLSVRAL